MTPTQPPRSLLIWLSLAQLISWGSTFYLFGLIIEPMEAELHISRAQSSLAFSLMLFAEGALAYAVGRWIDRGHARRVMSAGSAGVALCLLAHTQVTSLMGFYAVWAALGLCLSGVLYQPVFAVVTRRYPQDFRRAIITITFLGGLASTVFIPLTLGLIGALGWRATLVVLAGINLLVCLPVHGLLLRGEPTAPVQSRARPEPLPSDSLGTHLRSPVFWLIGLFSAVGMAITAAIPPHLVPLLRERALSEHWVMLVPASIGIVQVVGRFMIYKLEHHFNVHRVNRFIVLLMPVSLLLLAALMLVGPAIAVVLGLVFATVFGLANGMLTIVKGTAMAEYVSRTHVASLNGALGLPSAIARSLAPLAIGALWGVSNNYNWGVTLLVGMSVLSGAAFVQAQRLALRQRAVQSE
jgi:MFS family permease